MDHGRRRGKVTGAGHSHDHPLAATENLAKKCAATAIYMFNVHVYLYNPNIPTAYTHTYIFRIQSRLRHPAKRQIFLLKKKRRK
jgi:hypothetical protein